MRVLGFDVALGKDENSDLELPRATGGSLQYLKLFERAKAEKRVLLTSSKRIRQLVSCPQSFIVDPGNLEETLAAICREFSIDLDPRKFLTVFLYMI